jgi:hypothetical protein
VALRNELTNKPDNLHYWYSRTSAIPAPVPQQSPALRLKQIPITIRLQFRRTRVIDVVTAVITAKKSGAARDGSKAAKIIDLLKRPDGVTLAEIMKATNWQAHSVRGFISGSLGKKMGLKVASAKRENGDRVYVISR